MKKSPIRYCSPKTQEQKRNRIKDLADAIVEDLKAHPNIIKDPKVEFGGSFETYIVSVDIRFRLKRYNVVMYFGYAAQGGEIYVERKGKAVSSGHLPNLVICMLENEAEIRLPSEVLRKKEYLRRYE